jgi:2-succinyl-5-enolpyruvyl-6-hydroxy-3-cyclohexene-1-carboxylate synthase
MFDFNYYQANDETSLENQWQLFMNQNDNPSVIEVFTPEKINNKILTKYF